MAETAAEKRIDFAAVREDFRVLGSTVRKSSLVYLDNAASSQMPLRVAERIHRYHTREHANVHRGIHTLSQEATDYYEATREKVRAFVNAEHTREIIFTSGTTDAINLVARCWGGAFLKEGDEILIPEIEHHANIVPWQMIAGETGAVIRQIPVNDRAEIRIDRYRELLSRRTALVAVAHVSNALGTIHPVKQMIADAHEYDVPVLVDGAQGVPHSAVDLRDMDADFYAFSAHKMCGPTGFGVLYGKEKWLEQMPPYRGGGDMIDKVSFEETTWNRLPHKFEAGTPPIAAGIGTGEAVDYLQEIGMDAIARREQELLEYATQRLNAIGGVRIVGTAERKASVISFVMEGIHAHDIGTILDQMGIAIRTGHHCAQPAMRRFGLPATARASLSFYNNREDIDRLCEGLEKVKEFF